MALPLNPVKVLDKLPHKLILQVLVYRSGNKAFAKVVAVS